MKPNKIALAVGLALASGSAVAAPFTTYDTRSAGMGGLSVVTASIDSAPYSNPAMLAAGRKDEGFGFLVTGGAKFGDPDNMTQDLTDFSNAVSAADPIAAQAAFDSASTKSIVAGLGGGVSTGFTWGKWAAAVSYQLDVTAELGVGYAGGGGGPLALLPGPPPSSNAALTITGVSTNDAGLSLARNFELGGMELAVGFTPKLSSVSGAYTEVPLESADPASAIGSLSFANPTSGFNLDAGVVLSLTEHLKTGVVMKNMLATSVTAGSSTINLGPQVRAGIAYSSPLFTTGIDMDITENDPLVAGSKSRYMIIGTEVNAFDWGQLRAGYRTNLSQANDKNISFGLGISPFGAHLDVALLYNPDNPNAGVSGNLAFGLKF